MAFLASLGSGLLSSALGLVGGPLISNGLSFLKQTASSLLSSLGKETFVKGFQAVHRLGSDKIGAIGNSILKYVTGKRAPSNYDPAQSYSYDEDESTLQPSRGNFNRKIDSLAELGGSGDSVLSKMMGVLKKRRRVGDYALKPSRKRGGGVEIIEVPEEDEESNSD